MGIPKRPEEHVHHGEHYHTANNILKNHKGKLKEAIRHLDNALKTGTLSKKMHQELLIMLINISREKAKKGPLTKEKIETFLKNRKLSEEYDITSLEWVNDLLKSHKGNKEATKRSIQKLFEENLISEEKAYKTLKILETL